MADGTRGSSRAKWFWKPLVWLTKGILFLLQFVLLGWAVLAIHYSNLPWAWLRIAVAIAFAAFGIWALWLTRRRRMRWVFAALFVGLLVWWSFILPSHDREWRSEVAVMPRAVIDGDRVRITAVRDFDYRSRDDFTVRYEEREVELSHLTALDFFVSYWMEGPVAHTFVSFIFDNAPPLAISIETRPEVGEGFDPIGSMFKQFELIYVVGSERDLVRLRTHHRDEEVFLYHLRARPENVRQLLLVYLERINELADEAEFYHLLSNSCTINIVRYANLAGRIGTFDIRHLLNGWIYRYFYDAGLVDTSLSFQELRRRAHINAAALAADPAGDFSRQIRASIPDLEP